jgi:3',5'-cyclic AMP phosphodiesterase CpdA
MRTLIHLSDLHFGRFDDRLIQPLIDTILKVEPDLIAVSGDLTQRARLGQFHAAQDFLRALPFPQIVVPGNHDVPLYNVYARFTQGLKRFRRYIAEDLEPFYADEEIAVLGLNTARSLTFKGGRVNRTQINRLLERLGPLGTDVLKVVVTHHPFDLPEHYPNRALVGRARIALEQLADQGIDLFLAGHLHISHAGIPTLRFKTQKRSALFIQAGTATSTRGRGEANAFNMIFIEQPDITVERFAWDPNRNLFIGSHIQSFRRTPGGWMPLPNTPADQPGDATGHWGRRPG